MSNATLDESSRGENVDEIFDMLKTGDEVIKFSKNKDVVLVLGNTGAGKSTLTHFVTGDNNDLISKEVTEGSGEYIIEDTNDKVSSTSTILSKTLYPDRVLDLETGTIFYDCPGFIDTRSAKHDIAATYFIKKVTDFAHDVKLVFVVNHSSVRKGVDRNDFMLLLYHACNLINDINKFKDSIALVVTKVDNKYIRKGRTFTLVPDEVLISSVVEFIEAVKTDIQTLANSSGAQEEKQIFYNKAQTLIEIILTYDGKYRRIGLFRRPDDGGRLSQIPLLQEGKRLLKGMIHHELFFSPKSDDDFGYTISAQSKNYVQDLGEEINESIVHKLAQIGYDIREYFKAEENRLKDINKIHDKFSHGLAVMSKFGEKDYINENSFIKNIVEGLNGLDINISNEHILTINNYLSYLKFLSKVSDKSTLNPLRWSKGFSELMEYLYASQKWYNFLINLYNWLSDYSVQQKVEHYREFGQKLVKQLQFNEGDITPFKESRSILVSNTNIKEFLDEIRVNSQEHSIKSIYSSISDSNVNRAKIELLKKVIHSTLDYKVERLCEKDKLTIQGNFVKLSDVNWKHKCPQSKFIEIFATSKVFIDINLDEKGSQVHLSIISPVWDILGDRVISLDGMPGKKQSKPTRAFYKGGAGENGKPGLPGGHGGNFLGIAGSIQGGHLTISNSGGRGGAGQDGGDGAPGVRGRDAPMPPESAFRTVFNQWSPDHYWEEKGVEVQKKKDKDEYIVVAYYYYKGFGSKAVKGGDGGNGGIGGKGGYKGHSKFIDLSNSKQIYIKGTDGEDGELGLGGKGGEAAENGYSRDADCSVARYVLLAVTNCDNTRLNNEGKGDSGKDGQAGAIVTGRKDPQQPSDFVQPSNIVNRFKNFLRKSIPSSVQESYLMKFQNDISNTEAVQNFYDTLGLVDELKGLEETIYTLDNNESVISCYESLKSRINKYATNPKENEKSNEYRKVLTNLYTATLSKLSSSSIKAKSYLILNIQEYFRIVKENINSLQDSKNDVAINNHKEQYLQDIEKQVANANQILQRKAFPEINNITNEMNENIKILINDILISIDNTENEEDLLYKQREELERSLLVRSLIGPIRMISDFLGFLGPAVDDIVQIVQDVGVIADSFSLGENNGTTNLTPALDSLTNIVGLTIGKIYGVNDEKRELLTSQLNDIGSIFLKLIGKGETSLKGTFEHIEKAKEKLNKDKDIADPKILEVVRNEVTEELNTIVDGSKSSKEFIAAEDLNKIQQFLNITDVSPDLYTYIKQDKSQLKTVKDALKNVNEKKKRLKQFEINIYNIIIPKCIQIENILNNVKHDMSNKSQVELLMKQWEIQTTIQDIKSEIKQLTSSFDIGEDLDRSFEKLIEVMSYIINIYDLLEGYYDKAKLAVYIAHVNSNAADEIHIHNNDLKKALTDLDYTIRSNIILEEYNRAMEAFTQHIFPFAHLYLDEYRIPSAWTLNKTGALITSAVKKIEKIQSDILKSNISINIYDEHIHSNIQFTSRTNHSLPFYVWKNNSNKKTIQKLLLGAEVILKADILKGIKKNAVKFSRIGINLKTSNKTIQSSLNKDLENYQVKMVHYGNSNFKCGNKYYIIASEQLTIKYHWLKDSEGIPVDRNLVFDKIKSSNYILSPYALWSIQLNNEALNYHPLYKYIEENIDLELEGIGQYIDEDEVDLNVCNDNMDNYYNRDKSILEYEEMLMDDIDIRIKGREKRDADIPPAKNGAANTMKNSFINNFISLVVTGVTALKYINPLEQMNLWSKEKQSLTSNYEDGFDFTELPRNYQLPYDNLHDRNQGIETVDSSSLNSSSNLCLWNLVIRKLLKNKNYNCIHFETPKELIMPEDSHMLAYSHYVPPKSTLGTENHIHRECKHLQHSSINSLSGHTFTTNQMPVNSTTIINTNHLIGNN